MHVDKRNEECLLFVVQSALKCAPFLFVLRVERSTSAASGTSLEFVDCRVFIGDESAAQREAFVSPFLENCQNEGFVNDGCRS